MYSIYIFGGWTSANKNSYFNVNRRGIRFWPIPIWWILWNIYGRYYFYIANPSNFCLVDIVEAHPRLLFMIFLLHLSCRLVNLKLQVFWYILVGWCWFSSHITIRIILSDFILLQTWWWSLYLYHFISCSYLKIITYTCIDTWLPTSYPYTNIIPVIMLATQCHKRLPWLGMVEDPSKCWWLWGWLMLNVYSWVYHINQRITWIWDVYDLIIERATIISSISSIINH